MDMFDLLLNDVNPKKSVENLHLFDEENIETPNKNLDRQDMNTTQLFHDRMNTFDIDNDVESDFKHSRYFDGLKQNYCSPNQKIDVSGLDYSFG
jgi:hypothetical protein